ncbi:MAG TPA: alanine dehydrogenase [Bradyrhizobium sp.]|uniref:alanine dehydrogenase n=1 Tax=Bradyrhizobium sp. TaxID=376 RepID=UPI002D1D2E3B|nr:alanine dehydrogenase [Bradyrhizobium sp.]HLZ05759.1 alanine dehydrogenase [Bradyrhizobium sp.]
MLVGVPREIKDNEFRVGMTPAVVTELVHHGHSVLVETSAGLGSGLTDEEYRAAGATIVATAGEIFARADMVVKVKEPQEAERRMLRNGQTLFTYLHLAPDRAQTEDLIKSGAICIAYETVTSASGGLPLLAPMSEVAGRLAPQVGAHALEKAAGGRGILLGGVPGAPAADVLIIGGGVSGTHAATIALGMGAHVTILDRSLEALRRLSDHFGGRVQTIFSTRAAIREWVTKADLVIGAVLVPGASAPKLITREMLRTMKQGAVLVDIAIDQGGCAETSKPTTHSHPTYVVDGVVHYCVANMPGAVARTSTFALNNATLPFTLALADKGWRRALSDDPHLRAGLNVCAGHVTCEPVAAAHGLPYRPAETLLSQAPLAQVS